MKISTRLRQILFRPKLLIPIAISTVLVIVAVVTIASRSDRPVGAATRPLDVKVVQVKQEDVPVYSEWIGTTEGLVNADIKAQVTGYFTAPGLQRRFLRQEGPAPV